MGLKNWIGRTFGLLDAGAWSEIFGTGSAAGKPVTDHTALQLSTVWACTRLTAGAVSSIPVRLYQKGEKGGRVQVDHPLNEILTDSPNADLDAGEFWEAMAAWLCVRGNAFAEISRSGSRIVALNIVPADQVNVVREAPAYELRYRFTDRGKAVELPAESMLHIRGFGFGGDLGLSPVRFGAQTFGSAIAAEEAAAKSLASGMMTSGLLVPPEDQKEGLTDAQKAQLNANLEKLRGSSNAGKTLMVPPGFKYEQLSLEPETMQLLETRRHSVEDCCRWFGVPPIMVSHAAQGQTMWGTGVEAIILQWMVTGLNPLISRIEKRIKKQLLTPAERARGIYPHFNREALLQMDSAAKAAFLSTMVQNGVYSRARARELMDEPYIEGTDGLTVQSNLVPLDRLGVADPRAAMREALGIEDPQ